MHCPGSSLPAMKYCPYCGDPLEGHQAGEPEGDEGGVTIVMVAPEAAPPKGRPAPERPDIPKRLGLTKEPDVGSFHDRVAKRIRRTVSGKE